jgi:hypothetical protein
MFGQGDPPFSLLKYLIQGRKINEQKPCQGVQSPEKFRLERILYIIPKNGKIVEQTR